ncbi:hypothetical protein JL722_7883 [Aureococcus anophagefferens]|nr:hypothetical protein JL722_7883 [Aureococcus anophagefferens]
MSAGDNSFELSSDEEDDILGTLRQQTAESRSSGGRSSTSYDPYGADTNSSSSAAFGRAPGTTSTSGDFGAMRDAFREAGLEDAAAPAPGASADDSLVVDFGAGLPPPGQSLEQADRDDGVVVASRDGLDGTAEVEFGTMRGDGAVQPRARQRRVRWSGGPRGAARARASACRSPRVARVAGAAGRPADGRDVGLLAARRVEAASPLPRASAARRARRRATTSSRAPRARSSPTATWTPGSESAAESPPRPRAARRAFAALAAAESDDDAPPSPPARRSAGRPDSGELPRPRDEAERLIAELQRDNERLSASLKAAYERAEAQERAAEEERATLTARIREAETEAKLASRRKRPPSPAAAGRTRAACALAAAERDALAEELAAVRRAARDDAAELKARVAAAQQAADAAGGARASARRRLSGDGRAEALEAQLAAAGERLAWFAENQRLVDEHVDVVRRQERELADLRRAVDGKLARATCGRSFADAERARRTRSARSRPASRRRGSRSRGPRRGDGASTDVAGRGSGKSEDQAKARDLREARDRVAYLEMALGDVTSRLGAAEKRLADGAGPVAAPVVALRRPRTASVDSVPPPSAPPPPSPSRGDAPMTADALRIRSSRSSSSAREINRVETPRRARRQDDVARCVHDAKVAARMELARAAARHAEELHAKDNQLQRFKFELDGLLDALKAEIANTAAGNTTKHDKTAQAYRAYAKETAE